MCGHNVNHGHLMVYSGVSAYDTFYCIYLKIHKISCCHLMINPFSARLYTSPDSVKPFEANIVRKMFGCQALISTGSSNIPLLLPHRQLGGLSVWHWRVLWPQAHHICKSLYRSMFDTCQQVDYSLRPRTGHCTKSWC